MNKCRKKPIEHIYYHYTGDGFAAMEWATNNIGPQGNNPLYISLNQQNSGLYLETLEGHIHVSEGDYIIKGVEGEFWAIKPSIFEKTYEIIPEPYDPIKKAEEAYQTSLRMQEANKKIKELGLAPESK